MKMSLSDIVIIINTTIAAAGALFAAYHYLKVQRVHASGPMQVIVAKKQLSNGSFVPTISADFAFFNLSDTYNTGISSANAILKVGNTASVRLLWTETHDAIITGEKLFFENSNPPQVFSLSKGEVENKRFAFTDAYCSFSKTSCSEPEEPFLEFVNAAAAEKSISINVEFETVYDGESYEIECVSNLSDAMITELALLSWTQFECFDERFHKTVAATTASTTSATATNFP